MELTAKEIMGLKMAAHSRRRQQQQQQEQRGNVGEEGWAAAEARAANIITRVDGI